MVYNLYGIGTNLSAEREITNEELVRWSEYLPIKPYTPTHKFYIATESFVFLFFPIFPIKTFVYYYIEDAWWKDEKKYIICYYPVGEGEIYWEHVKNSTVFYIIPAIISALALKILI